MPESSAGTRDIAGEPGGEQRRLGARLCGRPEDHGQVYLEDFLEFFRDVLAALRRVDEIVSEGRQTARYRITDLSASSAQGTIEAVPRPGMPDNGPAIIQRFAGGVTDIQERGVRPPGFDYETFEALKKLCLPLGRGVQSVEFRRDGEVIPLTSRLEANIERIMGHEVRAQGALSGRLEVVSAHKAPYTFRIYPSVGPGRVTCRFPAALLGQVAEALKLRRYVTVAGVLHYRAEEPFPYSVDAQTIEVHPPEDELPTLGSLRGMAPGLTGDLDSVAFIRVLRGDEEG